jgi:hypothetical protein
MINLAGKLPLVPSCPDPANPTGTLTAGLLGDLADAISRDDHLKAFASIPGKDTSGTRILQDLSDQANPWGAVIALPVTLDDHQQYGRLPVGVMVLRSTLPVSESVLGRLAREVPEIDDLLVGPGSASQSLLDPSTPDVG